MGYLLGKVSENCSFCLLFDTVCIIDLDIADDAEMFTETTDVFAEALVSLSEGAEPLRLRVSSTKTKIQAIGDILVSTEVSVPVSRKYWKGLPNLAA